MLRKQKIADDSTFLEKNLLCFVFLVKSLPEGKIRSSECPFFLWKEHCFRALKPTARGRSSTSCKWTTLPWLLLQREMGFLALQRKSEKRESFGFSYILWHLFQTRTSSFTFHCNNDIRPFLRHRSNHQARFQGLPRTHWFLAASINHEKEEKDKFSK